MPIRRRREPVTDTSADQRTDDILLVVGGGQPEYRWWDLDQLRSRYQLKLISARESTWERSYFTQIELADPHDEKAMTAAAERIMRNGPVKGVLSYHEPAIEAAAELAGRLGRSALPAAAARLCRDKHEARRVFAEHQVPSAQSRLALSENEALTAAAEIGLPVIVKPRAMAASFGVSLASDQEQVRHAFGVANVQLLNDPWTAKPPGVLIEEYLDGPELSIDSLVVAGRVTPLIFAAKLLGFPPSCEAVGHIAGPARDVCGDRLAEVLDVVAQAHAAVGVQFGATHTELRLTTRGVRVIELNGRSGGDCIGYLGYLASGVNLPLGTAAAACQQDITPAAGLGPETAAGAAGIGFCYPPGPGVVTAIGFAPASPLADHVDRLDLLAQPGQRIEFREGRMHNARAGYAIVTGRTVAECADRLAQATAAFRCDIEPAGD